MGKNKNTETKTPATPKAPRVFFNWTSETAQRACVMRKEGRTNADIIAELQCPKSSLIGLLNKLKKSGVEVPRAPGSRQSIDLKQLGAVFAKPAAE